MFVYILAIVICYLIGAVPFGLILGKLIGGVDIRTLGSGNIGATNVGRVLGRPWGALAFALDVAKGLAPVAVVGRITEGGPWLAGHPSTLTILAGAAAICGHVFPVYLKFRGGKGVATSCGVLVYLSPLGAAVALGAWLIMVAIWRYVSLGSITAAIVFLVYIIIAEARSGWPSPAFVVFGFIMAALVIFRHRSNIQRLLAGTESRIGRRRDQ